MLVGNQGQLKGQGVDWAPVSGLWQMLPTEPGRALTLGWTELISPCLCLLLASLSEFSSVSPLWEFWFGGFLSMSV